MQKVAKKTKRAKECTYRERIEVFKQKDRDGKHLYYSVAIKCSKDGQRKHFQPDANFPLRHMDDCSFMDNSTFVDNSTRTRYFKTLEEAKRSCCLEFMFVHPEKIMDNVQGRELWNQRKLSWTTLTAEEPQAEEDNGSNHLAASYPACGAVLLSVFLSALRQVTSGISNYYPSCDGCSVYGNSIILAATVALCCDLLLSSIPILLWLFKWAPQGA